MLYKVIWRDGSETSNLDYDESMRLINERPTEWGGVRPMDYGCDCSPENVKAKEAAWGTKKKKK